MFLPQIILPHYTDGDAPNVIRIGGHCYVLKPQRTNIETTSVWDDVESEWDVCQECETETYYTKLLLHGDGDLSNSRHDLTYNGGVKLDYVAIPTGAGAFYFDGSDDYISIPDSSDWDFGNGDFTVEFYAKADSYNAQYNTIISQWDGVGSSFSWAIDIDSLNNRLQLAYSTDGTAGTINTITGDSISLDTTTFHHYMIVRNSSDILMFFDGVLTGSGSISTDNIADISRELRIGASYEGNYFNGHIADMSVLKGVAKYTSDFTPPTERLTADSNTVLLLSGQGDYGSVGVPITTYNGVQEQSNSGKFYGAFYFDGSDDYISIPDISDWDFSTNNWTIDLWFRPTSDEDWGILSQYEDSSNRCGLFRDLSSGIIYFRGKDESNDWSIMADDSTINVGAWNHIAIVNNGNGSIFINGINKTTSSPVLTDFPNVAASLDIGLYNDGTNYYFRGHIDELRISKGIARWTSNFIPPSKPYDDEPLPVYRIDQNTKLLLHGDGDLSNSRHDLTYNGGVKLDYVATPVGSGAFYFDGTNDYISIPDSDDWNFGSGDFTIDLWVNTPSWSDQHLISQYDNSTDSRRAWALFSQNDGDLDFVYHNGTSVVEYPVSWGETTNQFVHIAVVRDGSNLMIFVDGTQVGTTHNIGTTTIQSVDEPLYVAHRHNGTSYFNGYIDELRVSKGVARYTSNFTPLTSRAQPDANTVLLLSGSGDYGTTGHSITTHNGVKESSDSYKFGSGAFYFDGSNDYLSVPDSDDWNFGSGDFTIDLWVYPTAVNGYRGLVLQQDHPTSDGWYFDIYNGKLEFFNYNGSNTITSTETISTGTWNHVAFVCSSGIGKFYINGTETNYDNHDSVGIILDESLLLNVGGYPAFSQYFEGYIDELRISKGIARWTSNFTPPHFQYTEKPKKAYEIDQNTKLLLHGDGDLSNSRHDLIYNGGVKLDYVATPVGEGAYYFDGIDDYINVSDSTDWDFGIGNFGVEFWIYWNSGTFVEAKGVIGSFNTPEQIGWNIIIPLGTRRIAFARNGPTEILRSDTDIPNSEWTHIAIQRDGDNLYMFQNGTLVDSATGQSAVNWNSCGEGLSVGRYYIDYDGYYSNLHLADISISNTARYTSNFTPPTTRAQPDANTVLLLSGQGDYGTTGHSITTYNGIQEQSNSGKFYGAFYFDGISQYLSLPDSSDFDLGLSNSPFTIDFWYATSSATVQKVFSRGGGTDSWSITDGQQLLVQYESGTNEIVLYYNNNGASVRVSVGASRDGSFHHVAVVYDGTTTKIAFDGTFGSGVTTGGFYKPTPSGTMNTRIGAYAYLANDPFNGHIDEFRISKGIARWTSDFKPFPFPYTDV